MIITMQVHLSVIISIGVDDDSPLESDLKSVALDGVTNWLTSDPVCGTDVIDRIELIDIQSERA